MERQRCRPPSTPLDGYADPIISSGTIKLCGADYGKKDPRPLSNFRDEDYLKG